jgi:hypothetical protein
MTEVPLNVTQVRIRWAAYGLVAGVLVAAIALISSRGITRAASLQRTLNATAVVHQIQRLNEPVSVEYTIQKVIGLEEKKSPSDLKNCSWSCKPKSWPGLTCPCSNPAT